MKISVCMATYNGSAYLKSQLLSIVSQLTDDDELIISDDSSTDNTLSIISDINFKNIIVLADNAFRSPVRNFENALQHVTGDIVFLSDQDDIWKENKVSIMIQCLERCDLVVSDAEIIDGDGRVIAPSFYEIRGSGPGLIKNIYKNSYLGCCMAFNRKILEKALPFPENIPMHDIWIGVIAELYGVTCFSKEKLISYRRHASNASTTGSKSSSNIITLINYRTNLVFSLIKRCLFG